MGYTLVLCVLVVAAAAYGLLVDDAYPLVSAITRATCRAQDAVTLVTVPLLLWTTRRARAGSLSAHIVSVGVLVWLTYGYTQLSFGTPLNAMFLVYIAIVGLAGFAMLDGLLRVDASAVARAFTRAPYRAAFWFMTVAAVGIAALWLSEIVPALASGLPSNTYLAGLPSPTWVLDLAWIIPSTIGAASMLYRRHPAGPLVAGAILVMLLVLSATMLAVVPFALTSGLGSDPDVRPQLVVFGVVFTVLGGIEAWLLTNAWRRVADVGADWLRSGWWSLRPLSSSAAQTQPAGSSTASGG